MQNHIEKELTKQLQKTEIYGNCSRTFEILILLALMTATEIAECMCKYVDRISHNLQSFSPY